LADEEIAVPEDRGSERRGVGRVAEIFGVDLRKHLIHTVFLTNVIDIAGTGFFEGKPNVFSATGNARPVDELVRRICGALC
jgi:hypothetical protein